MLLSLHDKEPGSLEAMFQTHPLSSKRIAEAKAIIETKHAEHRATAADPSVKELLQMRALLLKTVGGLK